MGAEIFSDMTIQVTLVTLASVIAGHPSLRYPCLILPLMKFHPSGLLVAVVFYGLLWYAFGRGVDYGLIRALAVVALSVAAGWLTVGVIAESPLGPLTRFRTRGGGPGGEEKH